MLSFIVAGTELLLEKNEKSKSDDVTPPCDNKKPDNKQTVV